MASVSTSSFRHSLCSTFAPSLLPSFRPSPSNISTAPPRPRTSHLSCVRAAKLPPGVEVPKEEPKLPSALWGFTENAERWNARAAMIGIVGLVVLEFIIQKGVLELIGLEIGKGLNLPL